jgi:hypothetical protein
MKIQNTTQKSYYLVFQKVFEFKRFCGVASTKDEAMKLKKLLEQEKPFEKFLIVKIQSKEEKRV